MPILFRHLSAALWMAAMLPSTVAAQGVFDMGMLTNTLAMDVNTQAEEKRAGGRDATVPDLKTLGAGALASARSSAAANTTYAPSPARRQRNLEQFAARLGEADPATGAEFARTVRSRDPIEEMSVPMRSVGLSPADTADAIALYLVIAWHGVHAREAPASAGIYRSVAAQMARAMAAAPGFAQASDETKQEIADAMMVQALLADQAITAAKTKRDVLSHVGASLRQGARKTFGFDLQKLNLTKNGFQ